MVKTRPFSAKFISLICLFLIFCCSLFDEVSLDQFLAAAINAAQKAGEVFIFLSPLSSIDLVADHILKLDPFGLQFYIVQVIRKVFYETKHVEHEGQVFISIPFLISCSHNYHRLSILVSSEQVVVGIFL